MSFNGNPLCVAMLAHPITLSWFYLCVLNRCCRTLMLWVDCQGVTSVLLVCCTSAHAGVFHWVWAAAVGWKAVACMGDAGAKDVCAVGAVSAFTAAWFATTDVMLTGCSVTSTSGCVSTSGFRIWSRGPRNFVWDFADKAKWSQASKVSQYWPGSRACLTALEALAFWTVKYAFSHFSWYFFFKFLL